MKKILILGAGRGQLPFFQLCRSLNYEIIVASKDGDYPGFALADKVYKVDILDYISILEIVKDEKIDAILNQLDIAVPVVAKICDEVGLPSIGTFTARKFTNKYLMRENARENNISIPRCFLVNCLKDAENIVDSIGFPFVIKPADNSASKGVSKVLDEESLEPLFKQAMKESFEGKVLIEEYIDGQEYIVESFTSDYKTRNLIIGKSEYFEFDDIFLPRSRIFKGAEKKICNSIENRVLEFNLKVIESMGLKFGVTHGEYIYCKKNDTIYLIEIAARGGGVFIASDLVPLASNINVNELLLRSSLGESIDVEKLEVKNRFAGYHCFLLPKGIITSIGNVDKISKIPGVHGIYLDNIFIGKHIIDIKDKGSRFGPILVYGDNESDCYESIMQVKQELFIEINNQIINSVIW